MIAVSDTDSIIERIPFEDRDYPVRCHHSKNLNKNSSHLPNSIRTKSTRRSGGLSHLSAKEPELDEKSIRELLEFVGSSILEDMH